jgi:hypothetical protein
MLPRWRVRLGSESTFSSLHFEFPHLVVRHFRLRQKFGSQSYQSNSTLCTFVPFLSFWATPQLYVYPRQIRLYPGLVAILVVRGI